MKTMCSANSPLFTTALIKCFLNIPQQQQTKKMKALGASSYTKVVRGMRHDRRSKLDKEMAEYFPAAATAGDPSIENSHYHTTSGAQSLDEAFNEPEDIRARPRSASTSTVGSWHTTPTESDHKTSGAMTYSNTAEPLILSGMGGLSLIDSGPSSPQKVTKNNEGSAATHSARFPHEFFKTTSGAHKAPVAKPNPVGPQLSTNKESPGTSRTTPLSLLDMSLEVWERVYDFCVEGLLTRLSVDGIHHYNRGPYSRGLCLASALLRKKSGKSQSFSPSTARASVSRPVSSNHLAGVCKNGWLSFQPTKGSMRCVCSSSPKSFTNPQIYRTLFRIALVSEALSS